MLLTDHEISNLWINAKCNDKSEVNNFARAIEAAILAKLASAELPEPVGAYEKVVGTEIWQGFPSEIVEMQDAYSADQLTAWGNTRFAQGAASQLAEKPLGWCELSIDGKHIAHFDGKPLFMEGSQGNEIHPTPLYTRRQA